MKKIILLVFLTGTQAGYSQNYYENVTTVSADDLVFEVKLSELIFTISNVANKYGNDPNLHYQDGRELETLDEYAVIGAELISGDNRAIREAFGDEVIASLRSYNRNVMRIFYVVGPDGTPLEVAFIMAPVPELVSLKPEVFAALEHKLKKYVKWEPNDFSRKLKYFYMVSFIRFKSVPLDSEMHKIKPGLDSIPNSNEEVSE